VRPKAAGYGLQASGIGIREEKSHKPQATSRKARKSPFIPLFQRGKEGDLNIGTRGRPLRGNDKKRGLPDSGFRRRDKYGGFGHLASGFGKDSKKSGRGIPPPL